MSRLILAVFLALAGTASAQTPRPAYPAPRAGHVMASAGPTGGVYLVSGQIIDDTPRVVDSLWKWTGSEWRVVSDAGPRSRSLSALAYDTRRNVLVSYGGAAPRGATRYGDLWEWNGQRWEERAVATPGPRDHHAMTFDEARGKVVMYGGSAPDRTFANQTWTWDGAKWEMADSVSGPGGLVHHAMTYDSRRQRVVMVGGFDQRNRRDSAVWEWDGAKWERMPVNGLAPSPRSHHRMAYDAARGVVVLFGGGRRTNETWTWDGRVWQQHLVDGPSGRDTHAMAYDAARHRVVLFGGGGSSPNGVPPYSYMNDTWEWDGALWTRRDPGGRD